MCVPQQQSHKIYAVAVEEWIKVEVRFLLYRSIFIFDFTDILLPKYSNIGPQRKSNSGRN